MERINLKRLTRILLAFCGLALIVLLLVPMWRIDLFAPQYPEGLTLLIYPNRLGGNVDIINGLNHYIGMKTLHANDFVEFTVLPYIIVFFSVLLLITAIANNRKLFFTAVVLFICFGIIAMADFWRWEYNYGHNLDPNAAIRVPGMAYQPPLIGFKQLLNFGAYSQPDIGGWIFALTGLILLVLGIMEFVKYNRKKQSIKFTPALASVFVFFFITSCNSGPEPIVTGKDHCDFCKMTVSDDRYGAEIVTKKGKIYKFDDIHCVLSFLENKEFDKSSVKGFYFTDFSSGHSLIKSDNAVFLKSDQLRSPMAGNIAAFSNKDSLETVKTEFPGNIVSWDALYR